MKNLIFYVILFISVFMLSSCEEDDEPDAENLIDLTGEWLGVGYQCPAGVSHDESIKITHNLATGEIIALKITGDDCVTAGHITFSGNFDGKLNSSPQETQFNVVFITGTPSNPNSSSTTSTLKVIDENQFRDIAFEGVVFNRK